MIRRVGLRRLLVCTGSAPVWLLGFCLVCFFGCNTTQNLMRGKTDDDDNDRDRYDVKTLKDFVTVGNAEPVRIGGVAVVSHLDGTGGDSPSDSYHTLLEDQLVKSGIRNPKKLLADPEFAMVIVTGLIAPGTREGELFDVEVALPRGSKATSLRGGVLEKCKLFTYAQASSLKQDFSGSSELVLGHPVAFAEGPLLVGMGLGKDDDDARLKKARIYNGGRSRITAAMRLILNPDKKHAAIAGAIEHRLNETFYGSFSAGSKMQVAAAHDNSGIDLNIPPNYRHNLPHFLRVVLNVPMHPPGDAPGADGGAAYRQRLAQDLLDPARTVVAALRLEALGDNASIMALRAGLKSDNVKVRFCSAEALAYRGNSAGVDELATIVQRQPYLRAFALTALASLDQKVSRLKLQEILAVATTDEVRYGAFRALMTLNDKDETVAGEMINDAFWLHHAAPQTEPLVHISSTKRPEIVLFGSEALLQTPFSLRAGDFCVTATDNDRDRCIVAWVPPGGGQTVHREADLKVDAVLRVLAELGASYPEVVEILQQADQSRCLSCRLRADALPQLITVEELAVAGKKKADGTTEGAEILQTDELGATPNLYDNQRSSVATPFSK